MKKIIGMILVLAIAVSICGFAVTTNADEDNHGKEAKEYVEKKGGAVKADLESLFKHIELDAVCEVQAVEKQNEIQIIVALKGVSKDDNDVKKQIKDVIAKADKEKLEKDFNFLANKKDGFAELEAVRIYFVTEDAIKEDGKTIDALEKNDKRKISDPIIIDYKE